MTHDTPPPTAGGAHFDRGAAATTATLGALAIAQAVGDRAPDRLRVLLPTEPDELVYVIVSLAGIVDRLVKALYYPEEDGAYADLRAILIDGAEEQS